MSDEWEARINDALSSSTLLIPVIGPSWLSVTDQYNRRRIDNNDDWVLNEVRHALESKTRILPVLLAKTPMPDRRAFPQAIADLVKNQAFELRDERWETDLGLLLSRMEELGFRRVTTEAIRYPSPKVRLHELSENELRVGLQRLSGWRAVVSDLPGGSGRQRTELYRSFEFASFEDAIAFMNSAIPKIIELEHHPRWQNLWRTVSVWLSTWDIGHKPSELDLELAAHLDNLRVPFPPPRRAPRVASND
jgi:pterin-4a-carbinolamine dehydratase